MPIALKATIIQDGKKNSQNAENIQTARVNNKTLTAVASNTRKTTTDHSPTKKPKTDAHRAESSSAIPRASTSKTHEPSNAPIARTPQALSTAEEGKNNSNVAPKMISGTAQQISRSHPRSGMGAGLTSFLKKNRLGPYSGEKRKRE